MSNYRNLYLILGDTKMAMPPNNIISITSTASNSPTDVCLQNDHGNVEKQKPIDQNGMRVTHTTCTLSLVDQDTSRILPVHNVDDKNNERMIILQCKQSNSFRLEDLVQAGELQYTNQTLKDISEKLVNNFQRKYDDFPEFIQHCLTPIMYLIKRLQNLDDFLHILTFKYQQIQSKLTRQSIKTTHLSLRMLLHVLIINSNIFLRRIIMSLASRRNPVPFVSPNIENSNGNEQYEIMPSIIHVWNCTRPTILSFGIGPCQGKSTLLNQLFKSAFEQSVDSIYFQQTIDIDFGYCFNPERILNIADTHGLIEKRLLRKIQSLFDGFLIQIDKTYFEKHIQVVLEYVELLPEDKFQIIILRDSPSPNPQDYSLKIRDLAKQSEIKLSNNLQVYSLQNISNTIDRNVSFTIENLREELLAKIKEEIREISDTDAILAKLKRLIRNDYATYLQNLNEIIKPLKKCLINQNGSQKAENFPLYMKFKELCQVRQKLKKLDFYGSESAEMFDINSKLFQLENDLKPHSKTSPGIQCGFVFDKFFEILKSENMLMSLDLLASELKTELLSLGGDKIAGNLSIEHSFLSLEVLWRNAIVCSDHASINAQNLIKKSYYDFVVAGFPFEILDGDNFHFQHKFLTNILSKFHSDRMLAISIIGPQNSGKSTLLNYMFGTLFDVREGRCTRGIYGSLVKIDKSNETIKSILKNSEIDYIMLIDTEGLLSIEKADKEYDRRLVLFSLAVSHLVIVNMMGDVNDTLRDMLTLCADSLKQIGVNTSNQPIVHFVLNQKADPNLKNHMEAIGKIVADLKDKELAEVIDINTKTFHTLPSAFKKERITTDNDSPVFLRTEPDFIQRTQELCERIIESATSSYGRSGDALSNPPQWLKTAVNIFDTLQKFPDLTYFKDINERRQDDQIRKEIMRLITDKLSADYREKMINETYELTENEIRKNFQAQFDVQQNDFDNDLENFFMITNASDRIRDRLRQFLKRQITEICNAWCTAAIQAHDQKQMDSLVRDGSANLRRLIEDVIKSGKTMTKRKAEQEFEDMWDDLVTTIKHNFVPETRLKQAIKFVYSNYNIFEKECLSTHEIVLHELPLIKELSEKSNFLEIIMSIQKCFDDRMLPLTENALKAFWKSAETNTTYTPATLNSFKHLNKGILVDKYVAYTTTEQEMYMVEETESTDYNVRSHEEEKHKSFSSRVFSSVKNGVKNIGKTIVGSTTSTRPTPANPIPLQFDFTKIIHQTICNEVCQDPHAKSNIYNVGELFHKIVEATVNIVHGNDEHHRPIEVDLVQKVVGIVNTHINEMNLELCIFHLSLSRQIKLSIHVFILILLTVIYYKEQQTHFMHQLSMSNEKKAALLTYFISMIVPDAECDKDGADNFANDIQNAIQSNVVRSGQQIITREIRGQNFNRKYIQSICDGKLLAAASGNTEWLYRYIDTPTDIIVDEFKVLWKPIEDGINQQLLNEKNQWRNILKEFFSRIEFMKTTLEAEGSAVQYIDDIFGASGGTADENLTNKGQCMAMLLFTYLSGGKIQPGISYHIRDKDYTLKSKGLKLFDTLPKPSEQLANLIKGINNLNNSNNNRMVTTSIKNLHIFLETIMNAKNKVEASYDTFPATFAEVDKDQNYNKLLDKVRGCTAKCPCCERPCDVDHSLIKTNPGMMIRTKFHAVSIEALTKSSFSLILFTL